MSDNLGTVVRDMERLGWVEPRPIGLSDSHAPVDLRRLPYKPKYGGPEQRERHRLKRGAKILASYLVSVGLLGLIAFDNLLRGGSWKSSTAIGSIAVHLMFVAVKRAFLCVIFGKSFLGESGTYAKVTVES